MSEPNETSKRLVDQRVRNCAAEALEALADGDAGVREVGINDEALWDWRTNSCYSPDEVGLLEEVHRKLVAACDATLNDDPWDDSAFIASGWPSRIQPVAQAALVAIRERGKFREDIEEDTPSASY